MFDNNHMFNKSEIEIAEYNRGKSVSSQSIMKDIFELCDEEFCARIFGDEKNLVLIFADGDAFRLTLEKIQWVEDK